MAKRRRREISQGRSRCECDSGPHRRPNRERSGSSFRPSGEISVGLSHSLGMTGIGPPPLRLSGKFPNPPTCGFLNPAGSPGRTALVSDSTGWLFICVRNTVRAGVVEWQTRRTQNPVGATLCEFKSRLRHQLLLEKHLKTEWKKFSDPVSIRVAKTQRGRSLVRIRKGIVPSTRIGIIWRFSRSDLEN